MRTKVFIAGLRNYNQVALLSELSTFGKNVIVLPQNDFVLNDDFNTLAAFVKRYDLRVDITHEKNLDGEGTRLRVAIFDDWHLVFHMLFQVKDFSFMFEKAKIKVAQYFPMKYEKFLAIKPVEKTVRKI